MKKVKFTLIIVAITLSKMVIAQNTFPASGNVGIGTTNPSYNFDLRGSLATTGQSWLSFGSNINGYSWTNAALVTNSIEILNNIGTVTTSSPTLAFHRYGSGGPQFRLAADGSNVLYLESSGQNSARNANPYGGGSNQYFSRLYIDGALTTTGNVGIGTANPQAALDIGGFIQISKQNVSAPPADLSYGLFPYGGVGLGIFSGAVGANQGIGIWTNPNGNKTEVMRILSGGNVGIGTITPDERLAVNGTIHAKQVRVDVNGWPDYVFKPSYQLLSLQAVKSYIDQNHHLPELPSAEQVERDGQNLGEMNKLLLKKVEELTLYLITQQTKVEKLEQLNKYQEIKFTKRLKFLSKRINQRKLIL